VGRRCGSQGRSGNSRRGTREVGVLNCAGKAWSVAPNSDQMTVGSSMGLAKVGKPLQRSSSRPNQPNASREQ
jgi:hypothetical protein